MKTLKQPVKGSLWEQLRKYIYADDSSHIEPNDAIKAVKDWLEQKRQEIAKLFPAAQWTHQRFHLEGQIAVIDELLEELKDE